MALTSKLVNVDSKHLNGSSKRAPLLNLNEIPDFIDANMAITEFRGEKQTFLPQTIFDLVTTEKVIRHLVARDEDLYLGPQEEEDFVRRILTQGKRMFVTCIYGELSLTCVKSLFEYGLSDKRFPFKEEDCPAHMAKRKFRLAFLENQKRFNPAFFALNSEQNWDEHMTKPLKLDESKNSLLGQGAFGDVYKVWIHPAQRSFSSVGHL